MAKELCCAYRQCQSRFGAETGITFFAFPKNELRCKIWAQNCNREDILEEGYYAVHLNYRLCEKHFEVKYIIRGLQKRLTEIAVPTIFQRIQKRLAVELVEEFEPAKIVIPDPHKSKCQYASCLVRKGQGYRFFKFPIQDESRCSRWIARTGNPNLLELPPEKLNNFGLCEKHFKDSAFNNPIRFKLTRFALPMSYDGEDDSSSPYDKDLEPEPEFELKRQINIKTYSDLAQYEPAIKIEKIDTEAIQDPLQLSASTSSQNVQKSANILRAGLPKNSAATIVPGRSIMLGEALLPKRTVLKQLKRISANQAEVIKNLSFMVNEKPGPPEKLSFLGAETLTLDDKQTETECQTIMVDTHINQNIDITSGETSLNEDKEENEKNDLVKTDERNINNYIPSVSCDKNTVIDENHDSVEATIKTALTTYEDPVEEYIKKRQEWKQQQKSNCYTCAYLNCDRKATGENALYFVKFPRGYYNRALTWLKLCKRDDVLAKNQDEINKFLADSDGVCLFHYEEICKNRPNIKQRFINVTSKNTEQEPFERSLEISPIKMCDDEAMVEKEDSNQADALSSKDECDKSSKPDQDQQLLESEEIYIPLKEYCAFVNCYTHIKCSTVRKYRFPKDQDLLEKWKTAAGIPDLVKGEDLISLFVCGKHFTEDQYTKARTLQKFSIPQQYQLYVDSTYTNIRLRYTRKQKHTGKKSTGTPPNSLSNIPNRGSSILANTVLGFSRNWQGLASYSRRRVAEKCCVKHCNSDEKSGALFPFPVANRSKFDLWIKAVENREYVSKNKSASYAMNKICYKHFEEKFITDGTLSSEAIPTLDLFHEKGTKTANDLGISAVWKEFPSDICDQDTPNIKGHVKGKAILRENSIEFPNLNRELKFGKGCKSNSLHRFPYNVFRLPFAQAKVPVGYQLQMHTAIIIDDDDESEKVALDAIQEILNRSESVHEK